MNSNLRKSIVKIVSVAAALVFASILATGCGSPQAQPAVAPIAAPAQPANTQTPPPAPTGSLPNSTLFGIPAASANALLGVYKGTLFRQNADASISSQPYSATLYTVTPTGQQSPFAALSFRSEGAIGKVNFDSYLNIGLAGYPANGVTAFGFATSAQSVPELIPDQPFTLSLILSLNNGVFSSDPTHSAIFIKECGFSQGAACSNFAQDVWFGSDLRKQSP